MKMRAQMVLFRQFHQHGPEIIPNSFPESFPRHLPSYQAL
jgi:hypothetical protein